MSVHAQLASPLAAGPLPSRDRTERRLRRQPAVAGAAPRPTARRSPDTVGCQDQTAACLRAIPVASLLATQPARRTPIVPNVDGKVLPQSPREAFESGQFNRVPVVEGSTHDEFRFFAATLVPNRAGRPSIRSSCRRSSRLRHEREPGRRRRASTRSPTTTGTCGSPSRRSGPTRFRRATGRRDAQALSKFVPTHAYEFDDPNPPTAARAAVASFPYGAYHAGEAAVPVRLHDARRPRSADARPRDSSPRRWCATGPSSRRPATPTRRRLPYWPAYTAAERHLPVARSADPAPTTGFAAFHKCDFWDAHQ